MSLRALNVEMRVGSHFEAGPEGPVRVINPKDASLIAEIGEASFNQVDRAMDAAEVAFANWVAFFVSALACGDYPARNVSGYPIAFQGGLWSVCSVVVVLASALKLARTPFHEQMKAGARANPAVLQACLKRPVAPV